MEEWKEELFEFNGQSVYVMTAGRGYPIIMVHGAAADHYFFLPLACRIAEHYRVILYDRPGYGESSLNDRKWMNFKQQGELLENLIDMFCETPPIILGCSAGCFVVSECKKRNPDKIKKTIYFEPACVGNLKERSPAIEKYVEEVGRAVSMGRLSDAAIAFLRAVGRKETDAQPEADSPHVWENIEAFLKFEYVNTIKYDKIVINQNDCIGIGTKSFSSPFGIAARAVLDSSGMRGYYFQGGHNAPMDSPEEFAESLLKLIDND